MMQRPAVSIVMPVYNCDRHVGQAVQSMLDQTLHGFELIIVDDGSTDGTCAVLDSLSRKDKRIKIFHRPHTGIAGALNYGMRIAKCRYITRMDGDDISAPERLTKQVAFLDEHPDIGIVASWADIVDENCMFLDNWNGATQDAEIGWHMLFGYCIPHSSVTMRSDVFAKAGPYRTDLKHAEDFDLWIRARETTCIYNIPEKLLKRRLWNGGITQKSYGTNRQVVIELLIPVYEKILRRALNKKERSALTHFIWVRQPQEKDEILAAIGLIRGLYERYIPSVKIKEIEMASIKEDATRRIEVLTRLLDQ